MFKGVIAVILSQVLFFQTAFAGQDFSQFTFVDKYSYDFVLSTCHMSFDALANMVESTKADSREYFFLLNPSTYTEDHSRYFYGNNIFERKGIGKNTYRLISSDGYLAALRVCYPDSQFKRNLYTQNLLLFDAFGKIATLSIVGSAAVLTARGLAFAGRGLVVAPTVKILARAGTPTRYLEKIPHWMGNTGAAAFAGLILTSVGLKIKNILKLREDEKRLEKDTSDPKVELEKSISELDENLKLLNFVKVMESAAETDRERIKAEVIVYQQRRNVEYYVEQILSHPELTPEQKQKYIALSISLHEDAKNKIFRHVEL